MKLLLPLSLLALACAAGCTTPTHKYIGNETRQTVAGFAESDINDVVMRARNAILGQDRIKTQPGQKRAVIVMDDIENDTNSRGRDAGALAEAITQSLREELTNSGKVTVYDTQAGQYATVQLKIDYQLKGSLSERNLPQDNGDYQREYNLNLSLVELDTGRTFWQKRIHIGKLVDETRLMY